MKKLDEGKIRSCLSFLFPMLLQVLFLLFVSVPLYAAEKPAIISHTAKFLDRALHVTLEWQSTNPVTLVRVSAGREAKEVKVDEYDNRRVPGGYTGEVTVHIPIDAALYQKDVAYVLQLQDDLRLKSELVTGKAQLPASASPYGQPYGQQGTWGQDHLKPTSRTQGGAGTLIDKLAELKDRYDLAPSISEIKVNITGANTVSFSFNANDDKQLRDITIKVFNTSGSLVQTRQLTGLGRVWEGTTEPFSLSGGAYRMTAQVFDNSGNTSKEKTASFVLKGGILTDVQPAQTPTVTTPAVEQPIAVVPTSPTTSQPDALPVNVPGNVQSAEPVTPVAPGCATGQISCSARCVDPSTDSSNCGSCGKVCATGTVCVQGVCSSSATSPLQFIPGKIRDLKPVADWKTKIRGDAVTIADGMQFMVKDYLVNTSFKNTPSLKPVFEPAFQQRYLKRPVQYTEDVQELSDRLSVKRTLLVDAKNPCDPDLQRAGLAICFKSTGKKIKPETKQYLDEVRAKIRQRVQTKPNDSETVRTKPFLNLSDEQLLDQLLNKDQTTKIITHESVIPYIVYEFRKVPSMNVFDFKKTIPKINQISRLQPQTQNSNIAGAALGAASGAGAALTTLSGPGSNVPGLDQSILEELRNPSPPAPGPYLFPRAREISGNVLTGWTLGKIFGDSFEVEFADSTYLTDRYYARFSYTITTGFGLRWPFEFRATSEIDRVYGKNNQIVSYPANDICSGHFVTSGQNAISNSFLCAQRGTVNVQATAVNGDPSFYLSTGLPADKVYNGKEFVFEIGATCTFYASLPGPNITKHCPNNLMGFDFGRDFTPQLGSGSKTLFNYTVQGRPLGLALEWGAGYAALNPGVSLTVHDSTLLLGVVGHQAAASVPGVVLGTTPKSFTVNEQNAKGDWGIRFINPEYRVHAALVPSLQVEVGVDLDAYEWIHKFGPYNIDALGLELGSVTFPAHYNTKSNFDMKNIGTRPNH